LKKKKTDIQPVRHVVTSSTRPLVDDIRAILRGARQRAYQAVNVLMVQAYWNIGRRIVQEEQQCKERADYGAELIRNLARDLGEEFGKGVPVANLKNFRKFYLTFPDENFLYTVCRESSEEKGHALRSLLGGEGEEEKGYALRTQLTWTHWRLIMRVENPAARDWYIRETAEQGWRPSL